jgi:hypothetical protein
MGGEQLFAGLIFQRIYRFFLCFSWKNCSFHKKERGIILWFRVFDFFAYYEKPSKIFKVFFFLKPLHIFLQRKKIWPFLKNKKSKNVKTMYVFLVAILV